MSENGGSDPDHDADHGSLKAASGVGVVDTTSLWAAAKLRGEWPGIPR